MENWKRFIKESAMSGNGPLAEPAYRDDDIDESSDTSSEAKSRRERMFADMRARAAAQGPPTPSEFGLDDQAQQEVQDQAQRILADADDELAQVRDFLGAYTIKITARDPGKSYPRLGYLKQLLRQHFEEQGVKPLF